MRAIDRSDYLAHYGIKGMKWGVRRFQNKDGSYTAAGLKRRFGGGGGSSRKSGSGRARSGSGSNAEAQARKAKMKKALMIGAGLAGTAALAYGIKSGKLKGAVGALKNTGAGQAIGRGMTKLGNTKAGLAVRRGAANARLGVGNAKNTALSKYYAAKYDFNNSKAGQRLKATGGAIASKARGAGGRIAGSRVGKAVGGAGRRVAGGARYGASAVRGAGRTIASKARGAGGAIANKARGSRAGQAVGSFKRSAGSKINSLAARGEQVLADRKKANIQKQFANRYKNINRTKDRQRNFHNLVQRGSQVVDSAQKRAGNIKRVAVNKGMYVAGNAQRVPGNIAGAARNAVRSVQSRGITRNKLRSTLAGTDGSRLAANISSARGRAGSAARRVANNKVARTAALGIGAAGVGAGSMLGLTAAQKKIWERQGYTQYGSKRQKSRSGKKRR